MKRADLTAEQKTLLGTKFPAELEKEAEQQVKISQEMYTTGFSKMAAEAADNMDEEEEESKSEADKKLDEEQKKEASARGAFIARGYVDGLKKQGQDRHGDPLHYFYPSIIEKVAEKRGEEFAVKLAGQIEASYEKRASAKK